MKKTDPNLPPREKLGFFYGLFFVILLYCGVGAIGYIIHHYF